VRDPHHRLLDDLAGLVLAPVVDDDDLVAQRLSRQNACSGRASAGGEAPRCTRDDDAEINTRNGFDMTMLSTE